MATIKVAFCPEPITVLALVVPTTRYNSKVPVLIGTNVINRAREMCPADTASEIPSQWQNAFCSLQNGFVGIVKSTNKKNVKVEPFQTVTFSGLVRKSREVETAITENTDDASSRIGVCPRVVALDTAGQNQRVSVRIFNVSAKAITVTPHTPLCQLQEVKVLRQADMGLEETEDTARMATQTVDEMDASLPDGINLDKTDLSDEQKHRATQVFSKWNAVFSKDLKDIGHTSLVEHRIKLTNEEPFKEPYRRIPPALIEEVREHIQEMLQAGAIRNSESPYSSNVVIVRKKDGSIRFCVDFRKLNSRTIQDAYAIPRIEDSLHLLAGTKYFSKLDLRSGYWQVEVAEEDKCKTAFQVGTLGFYEFNSMPFGLCNAPATFQRLMERCMGDMNLRDCLIYLDDIVVFSITFEQHIERLEAVFRRLQTNNLKLKASKCEFFKRAVTYLGHVVSEEGICTDPTKTEAVLNWPVPKSVKEVRMFLGFTGYYRRFVKGYASIVRPLNDLLIGHPTNKKAKKGRKPKCKPSDFVWGQEQEQAFRTIIERLTHPPVLAYADYKLPFKLHTDASSTGLGAVLYQQQDGRDRVVAYASRSLKPAEKNYPAHKLEFLALKWAVTDKYHDYLYGSKFEAVTDNNPLTYILTTAKLDATGRRWVAALSAYNFTLSYRSGINNADADDLSRKVPETTEFTKFPEVLKAISSAVSTSHQAVPYVYRVSSIVSPDDTTVEQDVPLDFIEATSLKTTDWTKAQRADRSTSQILELLALGQRPTARQVEASNIDKRLFKEWGKLRIEDGLLLRETVQQGQKVKQLVVPERLRIDMFRAYHDDLGHQGRDRTLSLMKRRIFWPGMDRYVSDRIEECGRCTRRKVLPRRAAELVNIVSTAPMEVVCIDYLSLERSKGGFENILVITDHYTRYAQAIPTRNQTAQTTAKALFENFFLHYGFPARIHSDQGANFESKLIQSLCSLTGMKKTRTTPYHPMGNGMVERFNKTLLNMLGTLEESQKADWKSYVSTMTHAYNAAVHDSTGYSPFFLMFGRHPRLAVDAFLGIPQDSETVKSHPDYVDRLKLRLTTAYDKASAEAEKSAARQKSYYDEKVRHVILDVGDRVLVKKKGRKGKHRLANLWEHCPYVVIGQPVPDVPVYEVVKENARNAKPRTLHRNMLLPFTGLPCPKTHQSSGGQREKQPTVEMNEEIGLSDESEDRDSSESSADEEERELARYVPPMRRPPGQVGLLPRTKPVDRPAILEPGLTRGARNRRPPQWLRDPAWIRNQRSATNSLHQVFHL
ncbi:MAG: reverse transcriptase domain-containing protein [Candidatus Thiodiazotropha endolucinida]